MAPHLNITRRKMAEEVVAHEAAHDPLTGLANRTRFNAALKLALTPGPTTGGEVGVLYLDLDGSKAINDTLGHDAGDEVLVVTAHRLAAAIRPQDMAARLGGDEFAVSAPAADAAELAALAARISASLAEPQLIHGHRVRVPARVGCHLAAAGQPVDGALRKADRAMYRVKRAH